MSTTSISKCIYIPESASKMWQTLSGSANVIRLFGPFPASLTLRPASVYPLSVSDAIRQEVFLVIDGTVIGHRVLERKKEIGDAHLGATSA